MPDRKSSSDIFPADHHPALFLIQDGITSEEFSLLFCELILIISKGKKIERILVGDITHDQ